MRYDLLIRNGTIVDGTGWPAYRGNLAVKDGSIVAVGQVDGAADKTIDAEGSMVAPGFFDMHTHYDCQLRWDPLATSSCWHGVTTIITGNCGYAIAPGRPTDADYLMRMMATVEGIHLDVLQRALDWDWDTFGEYLRSIQRRLGINVVAQVGHSALRYYVIGRESYERSSTTEEIAQMKQILHEAFVNGAMGFSSSHLPSDVGGYGEPVPSRLATLDEILELASVMAGFGRGMMTMNPKPGGSAVDPEYQDLFIKATAVSGRPVMWSQLMHRWDMPGQWRRSLDYLDRASAQGAPVYALTRSQRMDNEFNLESTMLFRRVPTWNDVLLRPHDEKRRLLADAAVRAKLREEWDALPQTGQRLCRTDLLEVRRTALSKHKTLEGKRVAGLAARADKHMMDFLLDLSLDEDLQTQFVFMAALNGDPAVVRQLIQHPRAVIGTSDAGAHLDNDCGVDYVDVLLGHWVRDQGVMSIEEAVRRLTSMPAGILGIADRGRLHEGLAADVTVFNLPKLRSLPREMKTDLPGGRPRLIQKVEGIAAVVVNGQVLIEDGKHSGSLPGRVLGLPQP